MQIIRPIILSGFMAVCFLTGFTQNKIYLGIGTQTGKVTDITADIIKYTNVKGGPAQASVKDVFLLFNDRGGYLVPYRLDFNNPLTKNIVRDFINATASPGPADKIYTLDGKVIRGSVVKESKKTFTINDNGNKYDMDIKHIVAVIYKDGHHTLVSPVITVADILWTAFEEDHKNDAAKTAVTKTETVKPATAKPETTSVKQVVADPVKKNNTTAKIDTPVKKQAPPADTLVPAPTQAAPKTARFEDLAGNVSKEAFEKKALEKTMQLNQYLKVLCNKSSEYEERNKAVDLAVTLFINEDATVQTSSLNSDFRTTYKIRKYLQAIKLYNYDKVEIEWTKLQYVSNLKKGPDGNYYGTISFEQVFKGYIDGKIAYADITVKTGEVILKAYEKMVNGATVDQWEVLLGDISVKTMKSAP